MQKGKRRLPDFGGDFELCTKNDVDSAKEHLGLDCNVGERFRLLRENGKPPALRLLGSNSDQPVDVNDEHLAHVLPAVFRINARVPLPDSIPLYELSSSVQNAPGSRRSRLSLIRKMTTTNWHDQNEAMQAAQEFHALLSGDNDDTNQSGEQYDLGRSLLFDVAKIDLSTFEDLAEAIADGREGYANGLIQRINDGLAEHLNFPRWWGQDREFKLLTASREHDLVFTIRDKTGTDYSFSERSNGLKYFLSYHVQLLAHRPKENQSEILLMDEPDAYLSNQGQQDLLKILERFARPEDGSRRDQVVYVTHSPFLINRNAGERVRVLDKGVTDEGTRVVKDVARNHYEPLRSSLGAFVAETSFIGGLNLFVEGLADQVLLAGLNSHLIATGTPRTTVLDLNDVTIVPAGSASSVPYLVFLARGRDVVRPPCVVLLDSDKPGNDAATNLARGGPHRKELIPAKYVVQIGRWAKAQLKVDDRVVVKELEDIIPLPAAVTAAKNYATMIGRLDIKIVDKLTVADVERQLGASGGSVFRALLVCIKRLDRKFHIEKVGFAREIISLLAKARSSSKQLAGCDDLKQRFKLLLGHLAQRLRDAHRSEQDRRLNNRLERALAGFLRDHSTSTTREHAKILVDEVDAVAGDSAEGDRLRLCAAAIRRDFNLDENLTAQVDRYGDFLDRVKALRYEERFSKQAACVDGTNSSDAMKKNTPATDGSRAQKKSRKKL